MQCRWVMTTAPVLPPGDGRLGLLWQQTIFCLRLSPDFHLTLTRSNIYILTNIAARTTQTREKHLMSWDDPLLFLTRSWAQWAMCFCCSHSGAVFAKPTCPVILWDIDIIAHFIPWQLHISYTSIQLHKYFNRPWKLDRLDWMDSL